MGVGVMIDVKDVVIGESIVICCPDCESRYGAPVECSVDVLPKATYTERKWKIFNRFFKVHEKCGALPEPEQGEENGN